MNTRVPGCCLLCSLALTACVSIRSRPAAERTGAPASADGGAQKTLSVPETVGQNRERMTLIRMERVHAVLQRWIEQSGQFPRHLSKLDGFDGVTRGSLRDGWGRAFTVVLDSAHFHLVSAGRDGEGGTGDDMELVGIVGREEPCFMTSVSGRTIDFRAGDSRCPDVPARHGSADSP